jgi:hypothetical protein
MPGPAEHTFEVLCIYQNDTVSGNPKHTMAIEKSTLKLRMFVKLATVNMPLSRMVSIPVMWAIKVTKHNSRCGFEAYHMCSLHDLHSHVNNQCVNQKIDMTQVYRDITLCLQDVDTTPCNVYYKCKIALMPP